MQRFIDNTGVGGFPNVNDADGSIWRDFGIGYQPAFVFVDAEGNQTTTGALKEDKIQENIDELF
ncbi:MAG: hypothetical protein HKN94_07085 [Acidimicrobiales bacterium]|nr:hypothetical protein [Acidimicrobiales bacterium]RZV47982.1 MAG: hypothetical protein EX269_03605 [Acidimicrobiales bacterium]